MSLLISHTDQTNVHFVGLLCRDTAAGQALFKAYGGHQQAKVKGQQYSQRNQEIFQRMLALGVLPRPPKGEDCSAHKQAAAH